MSRQVYILVLMVVITWSANLAAEAQAPQVAATNLGEMKKDASRRTFRLDYSMDPEKVKETGVFLSPDSAALISPGQAIWYRSGTYREATQAFRVDFEGLEPYSRYFYKIWSKDRQNRSTWSEITPTYTPGFNIRWTGAQKWLTATNTMEIMLSGESVDSDRRQYQVFYRGLPCELLRITGTAESVRSSFVIRLPRNAPMGRHSLIMKYKQKKIFEENIEVL